MAEVDLNEDPSAEVRAEGPSKDVPHGGYSVTLPTFEGPLDLLLHLCQKHELDILDIPIAFVTEKYLEYLAVMQCLDLDVASEYLVMAATLAHIKSKMLLPAPPPGQEDEIDPEEADPRGALIRRLLEYQKYKQAAMELSERGVAQNDVFERGMPMEVAVHTGLPPLAQVPLFSLLEAFQGVLAKSKVKLSHDIVHERITLTDRINELVDLLRVHRRLEFQQLFDGLTTKFDIVITFLALLEMTKLRMTRLFQAAPMAPIYVEFSAQAEETQEPGFDAAAPADATTRSAEDELAADIAAELAEEADDAAFAAALAEEDGTFFAPDEEHFEADASNFAEEAAAESPAPEAEAADDLTAEPADQVDVGGETANDEPAPETSAETSPAPPSTESDEDPKL